METIKLTSHYENTDNVYSYYEFNNNAHDIGQFVNYIYTIIDYCDSFYYNGQVSPKVIETLIPNKKVNIKTTHKYNGKEEITNFENMVLYDIKEQKNKEIFKQNLRFNVSDPDEREPIKIITDCINIANLTEFNESQQLNTTVVFVKNNRILFNFYLYDGYIYDYTDECTKLVK